MAAGLTGLKMVSPLAKSRADYWWILNPKMLIITVSIIPLSGFHLTARI